MATTDYITAFLAYMQQLIIVWLVLSVAGCSAAYWLYSERCKMKAYASDIFIRRRCKEERKPLGTLTNKSGTHFEFVVDPHPDKPGVLDYKDFTLRNPNLSSSKVRGHLANGIPCIDYVVSYDFPVSHQTTVALDQLLKHVRKEHPELAFIDEIYIIEGVFKESKYAYDDFVQLVEKYIAIGVDIPDNIFMENMGVEDEEFETIDVMGDDVNELQ